MGTLHDFAIQNGTSPAMLAKHMMKIRANLIAHRKRENKWVIAYQAMSYIKAGARFPV
jgi:hypothetical protein